MRALSYPKIAVAIRDEMSSKTPDEAQNNSDNEIL